MEFDVNEHTQAATPSYERARGQQLSRSEHDRETALIVRCQRRAVIDPGLAFLSGFALAAVVVYLLMR